MNFLWKISIVVFLSLICSFYVNGETVAANENLVYIPDRDGNFYWHDLNSNEDSISSDSSTNIKFKLFTRKNPEVGQTIKLQDIKSVKKSNYDKNKPTRLICHGWFNNIDSDFSKSVRKAYLDAGDFNVVVVDWGSDAFNFMYPVVAKRTMDVGKTVANFLNYWHLNGFLNDFQKLSMVGHSLGAHVVGIAGKHLLKKALVIYGLDPASAMFDLNEPDKRLDKYDAELTVGVRTNTGGFGFSESLAQIEFMPNGGVHQPGCDSYVYSTCAHSRAYQYFVESLKHKNFIALGCSSFEEVKDEKCTPTGILQLLVGENINKTTGYFYFRTDHSAPFGLGSQGIQ